VPDDHARSVRLEPVIVIAFDQEIDPAAVLRTTRLHAGGRTLAVRLATAQEVAADSVVSALVAGLQEGRWLALRPVQPLPAASEVRVTVERGTASAEGPRTTEQTQALRFRTYEPFRIVWHGCWEDACRPGQPFRVQLSNPVDEERWSPELVSVEPALPGMAVQLFGAEIRVTGESRANTQYRVTLAPALRDRFGQLLQEPRSVTIRVGAPQPVIMLPGAPFIVLDPDGPPRVMVHSQGQRALRVRIYRVTPEQWLDFGAALERWQRTQGVTLTPPGTQVSSSVVEPVGGATEFAETAIDLGPALSDGLGHAIVVIEPEGNLPLGLDRMFNRMAAIAWVQSTRIGLSAAVDAEDVFVWASSLQTGRPLAGADITALPTGRRTATSADGTARLALTAPGDAAIVARAGADAALLPAHEYAMGRGTPWERRPQANELRWYTFTDRGLYRPGETVHFKGWVRRLPAGRGGQLSLASNVTDIAFNMRGPRQEELASTTLRPGTLGGFSTTVELPEALNLGHAGIQLEAVGSADGGRNAWLGVQVHEFRRPEYEVTVQADPGPYIVGDVVAATLEAAYYGGGGLGGARLDWRVTTQPARYVPPGWQRWQFGRATAWPRGGGPRRTHELSGETDANGEHRLLIDLLSVEPPFVTSLRAEAQVHDLTRQVGSGAVDVLVHPAAVSVGLRTSRSWVRLGSRRRSSSSSWTMTAASSPAGPSRSPPSGCPPAGGRASARRSTAPRAWCAAGCPGESHRRARSRRIRPVRTSSART
jgi:alpha-2-macroglobulin